MRLANVQKIPQGKHGKGVRRRRDSEGNLLHQCRNRQGDKIWVRVPDVEYLHIPETWGGLHWFLFAVASKPVAPNATRIEQLAVAEVQALSFPVILLVERKVIRARCPKTGKRYRTGDHYDEIMWPGYLLVGFDEEDVRWLTRRVFNISECRNIRGCIAQGDRPIKAEPEAMKRLIEVYNNGLFDESKANPDDGDSIKLGNLVQILGGPFDEFTGNVIELKENSEGGERWISAAKIELSLFGSETKTTVTIDSLRKVGVAVDI